MYTQPFDTKRHPYIFENEIIEINLPGDPNHGRAGYIVVRFDRSASIRFEDDVQIYVYLLDTLQRIGRQRVPTWMIIENTSDSCTAIHHNGTRLFTNAQYQLTCKILNRLMNHLDCCIIQRIGQDQRIVARDELLKEID